MICVYDGKRNFSEGLDMDCTSELEKQFPRIARAIILLWGFPEFLHYVDKLYLDGRGNGLGFPKEVVEEVMLLHSIHVAKQGRPVFTGNDDVFAR
jgi:hypothetical protein